MPIGPTNARIVIHWFEDEGTVRSDVVEVDSAAYSVWLQVNPKKKLWNSPRDPEHVQIELAEGKILLTDKPKRPLTHKYTLIEWHGKNYRLVNSIENQFGGIYQASLFIAEHAGTKP